jgi:ABC-2 type transport system ATP-binding protein
MRRVDEKKGAFCENEATLFDLLGFVSEKRIRVSKLERLEPTLETLFMEVVAK